MSNETRRILTQLHARLRTVSRRFTLSKLLNNSLLTIGVLTALTAILIATEALFWVDTPWRNALFWLLLICCGGLLAGFVAHPLLRFAGIIPGLSSKTVAQRVSAHYPELEDRLLNLLDLEAGRSSEAPDHMIDGAMQMLHRSVEPVPLEKAATFKGARRTAKLTTVPVALILFFLLAAPGTFLNASHRLFSPGVTFEKPAPFTLSVTPGNASIVRGETLTITAVTMGAELPSSAILQFGRSQSLDLTPSQPGEFSYTIVNVREQLRYRILAGEVTSEWYDVTILQRPVVRGLQVTLTAPSYTNLPTLSLPPGTGDIVALPGTRAEISLRSNDSRAYVVFASGRVDTLSEGDTSSGSFTIRGPDTYHILLENREGIRNLDPITFEITPQVDLTPTVLIREPEARADLDLEAQVSVLIQLRDDYGFRDLKIWWRLSESRFSDPMEQPVALSIPLLQPQRLDQQVFFLWDLTETTSLDIIPGDVIEYYAEVRDNDFVGGYKLGRSAVHSLRMPSVSERYNQLGSVQLETENELESLIEESQRIRGEFEDVRDELRQNQQGNWEDQQQIEQLSEAQSTLQQRVDDLASAMEETSESMEGLVSDETLEKFDELREVAEEINSPELYNALEELQEAMESLNPRAMQEALDKYEFNEEMYRERLERTLDLFKNFQVQQKLEEAADRADDIAGEQERLSQEIADDPESAQENRDDLAEEQLLNKEEMEALEEHMEDIAQRMEELRNAPQQSMDQLNEQTQQEGLPQQMESNAQQMQEGQMQEAQQQQQSIQQSLQKLEQSLQDMLGGMQGGQQQINFAALQKIISDALRLSHSQEALRLNVSGAAADSPLLRDYAQQQSMMREGMEGVTDSLQSLARQIPQMTSTVQSVSGNTLLNMDAAVSSLVARNSTQAAREQVAAMTNLNELVLILSDLMDQLMNASNNSSSGGMTMSQMIQQMQEMAAQQQRLNQQIQEMFGQMQGDRLTPDMQARMQQLAAQQQALQQQLTELSEEKALAQRLAGDLNKIAAQMEESVKQLESLGGNRRDLQERQMQILTRLLDASRAMQERGKERRREGQTGQAIERLGPDSLEFTNTEDVLRRALLDALESGYTPDYQTLIRRYFERLQEIQ